MTNHQPEPLAKKALGEAAWNRLAEPVRRHYGLHCEADEAIALQGRMQVTYPIGMLPLILSARLFGALVHLRGEDVIVTVQNHTQTQATGLFWHRTFGFTRKNVIFKSRMEHLQDNEIIEYVRFGMGIRMYLSERDGALVFKSNGYLWKLGFLKLRLPDWLLLGNAEIIESADGAEGVALDFNVVHPWWGKTYDYNGRFIFAQH